jgi:hypothetical protein
MDPVLFAKLVSIPGAFFLGSYNFTFSQNVVPHLYRQTASVATPIFDKIFHRGGATIMPVAACAIAANCYLAYRGDKTHRRMYGAAAVLIASSLPLTNLVMLPGINRLIEIGRDTALQSQGQTQSEVVALLRKWVAQNYFRGSLHLTAGMVGLLAALT